MKGMSRPFDMLGRIVVPAEIRKDLDIGPGDKVKITVSRSNITLTPEKCTCAFCPADLALVEHKGQHVCTACALVLSRLVK